MKKVKTFQQQIAEAKENHSYWFERTKIELSSIVHGRMKEKKISVKDLAKNIGRSEKYINDVLAAEVNIKLEDFVKFCRVLDIKFQIIE